MIRISITAEAYEAISRALPLGSVGYETERRETGKVFIWLETRWVRKLSTMRGEGEDYSDVIIRLAELER
jgi:hypothetical protein